MLDYTGVKCPVCGVPFQKDDDIVVCPECGAPYHRECYRQAGKCVFDDLHREGGEWQPPAPPKAPDPSAEIKDRECPVCGTLNAHSALFCSRCGVSLTGAPASHSNTGAPGGASRQQPYPPYGPSRYGSAYPGSSPYGGPPFAYDPMGGVSPAETLATDVSFGDASKLVKQNTNYYMPVFRYIQQTGRNKFNFSAFLFSGAWMLYRKQYKYGVLVTTLMFALYIGFQCCTWLVAYPALASLAAQAGIDLSQATAFTNEQILAISNLAAQDTWNMIRISSPFLMLLAILAVMIFVGLRGNKMYMNHCVAAIQIWKIEAEDGEPLVSLDDKGGVNSMVSLCVVLCYFVVRTLVPLLLI